MWASSRGRHRRRGLPFFGGPFADRLAVKDAALKVYERTTLFGVRQRRGHRTGTCAGLEADQDKVLAWIKQQQDKQPHHRGDLAGPRRSNQKAGPMKDRVDRLTQGTKITSPSRPPGPPPLR
jgi:hypothetical protein